MGIKHRKHSSVPDVVDEDLVRPSDWNDDHVVDPGALNIDHTAGLQDALDDKADTSYVSDQVNMRQPASVALTSIADAAPADADIIEYDQALNKWYATKSPRAIHVDGGNF